MKAEHNRPPSQKEPDPAVGAETEIPSSDQPLLVLRYRSHQRILRSIAYGFDFLLLVSYLPIFIFKTAKFGVGSLIVGLTLVIMFPVVILGLVENLLVKDIRLYSDRMVKVRRMLGTVEIKLENAKYEARDIYYFKSRSLSNAHTKGYLVPLHGISFDQNMIDPKDVRKLNRLLAKLSGRNVEEFEGDKVFLERLMKEKKS